MASTTQGNPISISRSQTLSSSAHESTRWHFYVLCFYIAAQSFTIPLIPIGHWALWPGFVDFATALLIIVVLFFGYPRHTASKANRSIFRMLTAIFFLCLLSFLFSRFIIVLAPGAGLTGDSGFAFGIFQLYRLVQSFFIFWAVMHIPFTEPRLKILERISILVLLLACVGVFLTYSKILPTITFVSHLPSDIHVAGPWNIYFTYTRYNLGGPFGTIGYNHSYVSAQILLLLSFIMHLRASRLSLLDVLLLVISIFITFISESRAGLAGILLYALIFFLHKPRFAYLAVLFVLLMSLLISEGAFNNSLENLISKETIDRSQTLLDFTNTENLSDRDIIWKERLDFLNQNFSRWIIGAGFGNAVNSGNNAHMLPLHIILETGIVGLIAFSILVLKLLRLFWQSERNMRPIFWGSVALLFSSLTQETFYPVPAMGYFLGFYLCVVAIVLYGFRGRETESGLN